MKQGYLIHAHNRNTIDYIACARVLAKSIRRTGDTRPICLLTNEINRELFNIFDDVVTFDIDDSSQDAKFNNEWQVYDFSPFDQTFKIEADVLVTRKLDNWWDICKDKDLMVSNGTRTFKQNKAKSRYYRTFFDRNKLSDVYNGLTYFKKSALAKDFFEVVRCIFENWKDVNDTLTHPSDLMFPDTDSVYAIALKILNIENSNTSSFIQWVHMKSRINELVSEDWTKELVWELTPYDFRIGTISQLYPVHYYVKDFAYEIEKLL